MERKQCIALNTPRATRSNTCCSPPDETPCRVSAKAVHRNTPWSLRTLGLMPVVLALLACPGNDDTEQASPSPSPEVILSPTPYPGEIATPTPAPSPTPAPTPSSSPTPFLDADGDGVTVADGDCDDADSTVYPGADEIGDGKDNDCDGLVDNGTSTKDEDGDGFSPADGDCDDADATTYPSADDVPYDGIDQDCDGTDLVDVDGDHYPGGPEGSDCDDQDPGTHPDAQEIPYDGVDQDCDGNDLVDQDQDGVPGGPEGTDCDDLDPNRSPLLSEIPYDGIDQDCDGADLGDVDGDGEDSTEVQGTDCNDSDPTIFSTAEEIPYDGIDQNCDGEDVTDLDNDGYDAEEVGGDDCDDSDLNTYPGATEFADGVDNDCDGAVDEDLGTTDDDGDGYAESDGDCDDHDAETYPGALETPYDGIDQDCDGADLTDRDRDGYDGGPEGSDCDDQDDSVHPGAPETPYDGIDQDCDGADLTDVDGDGFDGGEEASDCDDRNALVYPDAPETPYDGVDQDCDGSDLTDVDGDGHAADLVLGGDDCNDADPAIHPAADEVCDGVDNNCDGVVDDDAVDRTVFYPDGDHDGFGDPNNPVLACEGSSTLLDDGTDCDDSTDVSYPGADEVCDGQDNDCDCAGQDDTCIPEIDEGVTLSFYQDADGDGFGNPGSQIQACTAPAGYVDDNQDCNDLDPAINPDATEVCDEDDTDEDCNGVADNQDPNADESTQQRFYPDADSDGYGSASSPGRLACDDPSTADLTYTLDHSDCTDTNDGVYPGAPESCNLRDDDCDEEVDEGVLLTFYQDADQDGFGDPGVSTDACTAPTGYAPNALDCDDTRSDVNPLQDEICDPDDVDEDCNGVADDQDPTVNASTQETYYPDEDQDGFGDQNSNGTQWCDAPSTPDSAWSLDATDCDDSRPETYPGAPEQLNGVDDNCNGQIDEGLIPSDCATYLASHPDAPSGVYLIDPDGVGQGSEPFEVYCEMSLYGGGWTLVAKMTNQDSKQWVNARASWTGTDAYGDTTSLDSGADAKSLAWGILPASEFLFSDNQNIDAGRYVATTSNCIGNQTLADFFTTALADYPDTSSLNFFLRCEVDNNYIPNWTTEPHWNANGPSSQNLSLNNGHLLIASTDSTDTSGVISFYREGYSEADVGLAPNEDTGFDTDERAQDIGGPTSCSYSDSECRTEYPETVYVFVR